MIEIPNVVKHILGLALQEDVGTGDITTNLLISRSERSVAMFVAKGSFLVAGFPFVQEVFRLIDEETDFKSLIREGSRARKGAVIAQIGGRTRSLLAAERVSLNVLQHLSGIATLTNRFVTAVKGTRAKITDTRKTMPCMRYMEKYAVAMGGGNNHRYGLYDGILIKDNHIEAAGGIKKALRAAREGMHLSKIEIEVENIREFKEALDNGADVIMLDNMSLKDISEAVRLNAGKALLETSGNVTLETVRELAATGVDLISVGALTHSAPAVDISMKLLS